MHCIYLYYSDRLPKCYWLNIDIAKSGTYNKTNAYHKIFFISKKIYVHFYPQAPL